MIQLLNRGAGCGVRGAGRWRPLGAVLYIGLRLSTGMNMGSAGGIGNWGLGVREGGVLSDASF